MRAVRGEVEADANCRPPGRAQEVVEVSSAPTVLSGLNAESSSETASGMPRGAGDV